MDEIRSGLNAQGIRVGDEIVRSFGFDSPGSLIRKGNRNGAKVALKKRLGVKQVLLEHRFRIGAKRTKFESVIPTNTPFLVQKRHRIHLHRFMASNDDRESSWYWKGLLGQLVDLFFPQLTGILHHPAFYLPADRTGVMHAHSVVVSAMIGSAPMTGLRPATDTPMLSGVLADFLQQLIELDNPFYHLGRSQRKSRHDLGKKIEEGILGGSVRVTKSKTIGYPHFTYQPIGWKDALPLMNASSMVSEVAPLVLYLRYWVEPGDVLIIEEPESHLHPAMQVEFTRQLAALVQAGVRVIITTHSEWVLEELANIVRRSELPPARRKNEPS